MNDKLRRVETVLVEAVTLLDEIGTEREDTTFNEMSEALDNMLAVVQRVLEMDRKELEKP